MTVSLFRHGVLGCHQCLCQHLPAEYATSPNVAAFTPKQIELDSFQVQEIDQFLDQIAHVILRVLLG